MIELQAIPYVQVTSDLRFTIAHDACFNRHLKRRQMGTEGVSGGLMSSRGYGRTPSGGVSKHAKATHVYRIVVVMVGIFFLTETIGNGLVFLRLRDTDLQGGEAGIFFPRSWEQPSSQSVAPGDGARFVSRVLLSPLRKQTTTRAPVRPPRLALVSYCASPFFSALEMDPGI